MASGIDFGKQIGPLPVGAWIAVVGGGLAIAYWQRNSGSGDVEVVEDTSGDGGVGAGPGQFVPVTPVPEDSDGTPEYASNEAWGQAAVN